MNFAEFTVYTSLGQNNVISFIAASKLPGFWFDPELGSCTLRSFMWSLTAFQFPHTSKKRCWYYCVTVMDWCSIYLLLLPSVPGKFTATHTRVLPPVKEWMNNRMNEDIWFVLIMSLHFSCFCSYLRKADRQLTWMAAHQLKLNCNVVYPSPFICTLGFCDLPGQIYDFTFGLCTQPWGNHGHPSLLFLSEC